MGNPFLDAVQQGLQISGTLDDLNRISIGTELVKAQTQKFNAEYEEFLATADARKKISDANVKTAESEAFRAQLGDKFLESSLRLKEKYDQAKASAAEVDLFYNKWKASQDIKRQAMIDGTRDNIKNNPNIPQALKMAATAEDGAIPAAAIKVWTDVQETVERAKMNADDNLRMTTIATLEAQQKFEEEKNKLVGEAFKAVSDGNLAPLEGLLNGSFGKLDPQTHLSLSVMYGKISKNPDKYKKQIQASISDLVSVASLFTTTESKTENSINVTSEGVSKTSKSTSEKLIPQGIKDVLTSKFGVPLNANSSGYQPKNERVDTTPGGSVGSSPENPFIPKSRVDFLVWVGKTANKGRYYKTDDGKVILNK